MGNKLLDQAIRFAIDHEISWSREITHNWGIHHEDPPPHNRLLGPVHARGPVSGALTIAGKCVFR